MKLSLHLYLPDKSLLLRVFLPLPSPSYRVRQILYISFDEDLYPLGQILYISFDGDLYPLGHLKYPINREVTWR